MPKVPKVIPISDEEYERQKAEKAARCQRYLVIGESRIRDAITRESMAKGEHVWLDPEETIIILLERQKLVRADLVMADPVKAKASKDV